MSDGLSDTTVGGDGMLRVSVRRPDPEPVDLPPGAAADRRMPTRRTVAAVGRRKEAPGRVPAPVTVTFPRS
ncbi:hypothetical protein [Micromonospora sp. HM5-17]|jgi:hypothetical protein|uniref:hypothetical protein n=1 Tax=Micromonospora sp. HM5-17 TaxID=2487710 RepID=UPI000F49270E|nr:hypothetical protein [Micromonospora sp. HM5-17]ROT31673.1 hypothetical protein EF879_14810 [Micromonospora sp. HM5-17]